MVAIPFLLHDNILVDGTVTATDTDAGDEYDVNNLSDYRTSTWWKAFSSGTKYITVDFGSAVFVNTFALIGHNFFTVGATLSIESSDTGAWGGEEVVRHAAFDPADNKAIGKKIVGVFARYWRAKVAGTSAAAELAVLFLGDRLTFPEQVLAPHSPQDKTIMSETEVSKAGHTLGTIIRFKPYTIFAEWIELLNTFVMGDYQDFWDNHGSDFKWFFWVPDYDTWPDKIFYVRLVGRSRWTTPIHLAVRTKRLRLELQGVSE